MPATSALRLDDAVGFSSAVEKRDADAAWVRWVFAFLPDPKAAPKPGAQPESTPGDDRRLRFVRRRTAREAMEAAE